MDDSLIIELLWQRSESALAELASKYGRTLHSISYQITGNHEDAEECVNDTYLGVWQAIPPARPRSLYAFVCRMVRNISLTRYRYRTAQMRDRANEVAWEEVADFIADDEICERELETDELTRLLEEWLWGLDERNRYIFLRRYWYMEDVPAIAQSLQLSEAAVYLRIDRMKKKLKAYLVRKGVLL